MKLWILPIIGSVLCMSAAEVKPPKPNVLLITVDDLRTELNCYGVSRAITPNIDKLAGQGMTFLNAYCQKAVCVPSRQSFLTGTRPNTFGAEFGTHFRTKLPNVVTLPQQFGKHGYRTRAIGKVFHHRDDQSWDEPQWVPEPDLCYPIYATEENITVQKQRMKKKRFLKKDDNWWAKGGMWNPAAIWEAPNVEDDALTDGKFARKALETLRQLRDKPFFLAIGFFRPHIPFIAPKKYYDLYPLEKLSLPNDPGLPKGAPSFAAQRGGEWQLYHNVAKMSKTTQKTRLEYIRGYMASVSYVDAQIGRVLKELERLKLDDKTIVVLMGDHGYHLFDKESFGKSTNFENATRVPFIVRQPGTKHRGAKTKAITELLDLYPSLCDLAGLPVPAHTQGKSFKRVLEAPGHSGKEAAYSQYKRGGYQGNSVRTSRYRFTRWRRKGRKEVLELYDYKNDPTETVNLSGSPEQKITIAKLAALLEKVFD